MNGASDVPTIATIIIMSAITGELFAKVQTNYTPTLEAQSLRP
ncbi:MAG: hypothetical protein ABI557_08375 [Aureliella sp.]